MQKVSHACRTPASNSSKLPILNGESWCRRRDSVCLAVLSPGKLLGSEEVHRARICSGRDPLYAGGEIAQSDTGPRCRSLSGLMTDRTA